MDKIIEEDHITFILIEMTLEGTILEKCNIKEVKVLDVDTEGIIEMIILEEQGVDLGTGSILITSKGLIETVGGLDHVQELVLIEMEIDASIVENMNVLLRTVQLHRWKKKQKKHNKCIIWTKSKLH